MGNKTALPSLPNEILRQIFEKIRREQAWYNENAAPGGTFLAQAMHRQPDLCKICLVSKRFNAIASPLLITHSLGYRKGTRSEIGDQETRLLRVAGDENLCKEVRSLAVLAPEELSNGTRQTFIWQSEWWRRVLDKFKGLHRFELGLEEYGRLPIGFSYHGIKDDSEDDRKTYETSMKELFDSLPPMTRSLSLALNRLGRDSSAQATLNALKLSTPLQSRLTDLSVVFHAHGIFMFGPMGSMMPHSDTQTRQLFDLSSFVCLQKLRILGPFDNLMPRSPPTLEPYLVVPEESPLRKLDLQGLRICALSLKDVVKSAKGLESVIFRRLTCVKYGFEAELDISWGDVFNELTEAPNLESVHLSRLTYAQEQIVEEQPDLTQFLQSKEKLYKVMPRRISTGLDTHRPEDVVSVARLVEKLVATRRGYDSDCLGEELIDQIARPPCIPRMSFMDPDDLKRDYDRLRLGEKQEVIPGAALYRYVNLPGNDAPALPIPSWEDSGWREQLQALISSLGVDARFLIRNVFKLGPHTPEQDARRLFEMISKVGTCEKRLDDDEREVIFPGAYPNRVRHESYLPYEPASRVHAANPRMRGSIRAIHDNRRSYRSPDTVNVLLEILYEERT